MNQQEPQTPVSDVTEITGQDVGDAAQVLGATAPTAEPAPVFMPVEPQYAIYFGPDGRPISRLEYSAPVENLPAGQVVCTKEQHDAHQSYRLVNGEIVACDAAELLDKAKAKAITAVKEGCQRAFLTLVIQCQPGEFSACVDELIDRRIHLSNQINAVTDDSDAGINLVASITWE